MASGDFHLLELLLVDQFRFKVTYFGSKNLVVSADKHNPRGPQSPGAVNM